VGLLNPALVFLLIGIPTFAFTFLGLPHLLPLSSDILQWLVSTAAGGLAVLFGALLVQRLIYRFAPIDA